MVWWAAEVDYRWLQRVHHVIKGKMYLPFYPYVIANGEKYTCVESENIYGGTPSFYFECSDTPDEIWLEPLL